MASIGIGIGFNALFQPVEPTWVAKAIATLFILLGVFLVIAAETQRPVVIQTRLTAHKVDNIATTNFRIMAVAISFGAIALIVAFLVAILIDPLWCSCSVAGGPLEKAQSA